MKRLRRWLFNAMTAVSLALCIVTAILWVRSYSCFDEINAESWKTTRWPSDRKDSDLYGGAFEHANCVISSNIGTIDLKLSRYRPRAEPVGMLDSLERAYSHDRDLTWTSNQIDEDEVRNYRFRNLVCFYALFNVDVDVAAANRNGLSEWELICPDWAVTLPSAVMPFIWFRKCRKRHRQARCRAKGLCLQCGYDLRATPNQCPECGTVAKKGES